MQATKFVEIIGNLINGRYDAYNECYREEHNTIPMEHFLDGTMNRIKRDIKRLKYLQSHVYTNATIDGTDVNKLLPPYYDSRTILGKESGFKKSNFTKLLDKVTGVNIRMPKHNYSKDKSIFTIHDMKKLYNVYLLNKQYINKRHINIHNTINQVLNACNSKYTLFKINNVDWALASKYIKSLLRKPDKTGVLLYLVVLKNQRVHIQAVNSPYNLEPMTRRELDKEYQDTWGQVTV